MKYLYTTDENFERIDRYIDYLSEIRPKVFARSLGEDLENILTALIKSLFQPISFIQEILGENDSEIREEQIIKSLYYRWDFLMFEVMNKHKLFLTADKKKQLIHYEKLYNGVYLINNFISQLKLIQDDLFDTNLPFESMSIGEEINNIKNSIQIIQEVLKFEEDQINNIGSTHEDII